MARNTTPAPASKEAPFIEEAARSDIAAANQLAVATLEQNERVSALALQLNYQGSTDIASLENSARDAIRRIGMGVFELGAYLMLLKESCPHGGFMPVLQRLKLEERAARQYMQVTRRFSNRQTSADMKALGVSKLTEMLVLDDEQIEELTELGQTGELALDDVSGMSVRELRAAVRKERAEAAKQKSQVDRLTAVNTELHEEARLVKRLPANEALAKTKKEAVGLQNETVGLVRGGLRQALLKLGEMGGDASHTAFMASLLGAVYVELDALRDEFGLPLAAVDTTPEWERWAQAQGATAGADVSTAAAAN